MGKEAWGRGACGLCCLVGPTEVCPWCPFLLTLVLPLLPTMIRRCGVWMTPCGNAALLCW